MTDAIQKAMHMLGHYGLWEDLEQIDQLIVKATAYKLWGIRNDVYGYDVPDEVALDRHIRADEAQAINEGRF